MPRNLGKRGNRESPQRKSRALLHSVLEDPKKFFPRLCHLCEWNRSQNSCQETSDMCAPNLRILMAMWRSKIKSSKRNECVLCAGVFVRVCLCPPVRDIPSPQISLRRNPRWTFFHDGTGEDNFKLKSDAFWTRCPSKRHYVPFPRLSRTRAWTNMFTLRSADVRFALVEWIQGRNLVFGIKLSTQP